MNIQLKRARFNLVVSGIAVSVTVIACLAMLILGGPRAALAGFGFLGIWGMMGLGLFFDRKKPGSAEALVDERDAQIRDRADLAAWRFAWAYWGMLCMGTFLVIAVGTGDVTRLISIRISWLAYSYIIAMIVHQFVWSVAIVIQYKGWNDEE